MSPLVPIFGAAILAALLIGWIVAAYAYPAHRCAEQMEIEP